MKRLIITLPFLTLACLPMMAQHEACHTDSIVQVAPDGEHHGGWHFEYNSDGTLKTRFRKASDNVDIDLRFDYSYGEKMSDSTVVRSELTDGKLLPVQKYAYEYDEQGYRTARLNYVYDYDSQPQGWKLSGTNTRMQQTYNTQGRPTETITTLYDSSDQQWHLYEKVVTTYKDFYQTSQTYYTYNTSVDEWEKNYTLHYIYDEQDWLVAETTIREHGISDSVAYEFNENARMILKTQYQAAEPGQWVKTDCTQYDYTIENGRQTTFETKLTDDTKQLCRITETTFDAYYNILENEQWEMLNAVVRLVYRLSYEYDEKGREVSYSYLSYIYSVDANSFDYDPLEIREHSTQKYDEDGHLAEHTEYVWQDNEWSVKGYPYHYYYECMKASQTGIETLFAHDMHSRTFRQLKDGRVVIVHNNRLYDLHGRLLPDSHIVAQ
ncbi:MAG: hypothetical protein MJZ60_04190 [Bacteroidaceae bacterium]|nr:hypothetical protein [Bacteroidaceae bacterium]